MPRKCYKLVRTETPFKDIVAGDLFLLCDDEAEGEDVVEDGSVINLALEDAFDTKDGMGRPTHGVQSAEVGLTHEPYPSVRPETVAWMETAKHHLRDAEYYRDDRNKLLVAVAVAQDIGLLKEQLKEQGYFKLIGEGSELGNEEKDAEGTPEV